MNKGYKWLEESSEAMIYATMSPTWFDELTKYDLLRKLLMNKEAKNLPIKRALPKQQRPRIFSL